MHSCLEFLPGEVWRLCIARVWLLVLGHLKRSHLIYSIYRILMRIRKDTETCRRNGRLSGMRPVDFGSRALSKENTQAFSRALQALEEASLSVISLGVDYC